VQMLTIQDLRREFNTVEAALGDLRVETGIDWRAEDTRERRFRARIDLAGKSSGWDLPVLDFVMTRVEESREDVHETFRRYNAWTGHVEVHKGGRWIVYSLREPMERPRLVSDMLVQWTRALCHAVGACELRLSTEGDE